MRTRSYQETGEIIEEDDLNLRKLTKMLEDYQRPAGISPALDADRLYPEPQVGTNLNVEGENTIARRKRKGKKKKKKKIADTLISSNGLEEQVNSNI